MKSLTILTIWILLILPSFSIAQELPENFPPLETVYKHLDEQMNFPCDQCYYELAKKMDGYYVMVVDYEDLKHDSIVYVKLWDAATKKFLKLNLKKDLNFQTMDENLSYGHEGIRQKQRECDFNYLYGYENYTTDLIKYLESKSSLKTKELEMLARAYSTEATNFIHPNISGVFITESKNLPTPDYEKISSDRVNSFRKLAEKSIGYYEQIKKIDPDYKPMLIEGIDLKINEDLMHYYQTMKAVKEDQLAQSFLDRIHFSETEIAISKMILDGCEQSSIYFPAGDTDSYPLWYVQEKLNYRKDVSILHSVLLYTSWYFDYVKQNSQVKISLTLAEHKSISAGVVRISESISEFPSYEKWLKGLRSSMAKTSESDYPEAPGIISFKGSNGSFTLSAEGAYFTIVDVLIMDLIANNPNRKIYVSHPSVFEDFSVQGHFVWRGPFFEFIGAEEVSYIDEKSIELLKNSLSNPTIDFSVNSSPFDLWLFDSWGITLAYAHDTEQNGFSDLYTLYKQKINVNELINANEQRTLNSYKSAVEAASSEDLEELLKLYTPTALKMLKDGSEQKTLSAKNLENITFIFKMYTPNKRKEIGEKIPLTPTQKKILQELNDKITRILASKLNEDLMWTRDGLENIQESLEFYDL